MTQKFGNATAKYAFVQGMFWMSFSVILIYASAYLLSKDFSNTQIGLLIAVAGTVSSILQPLVAGFADSTKKISLKKIVSVFALMLILLAAGLLLAPPKMLFVALLYGMIVTFLQVMTPLVYSLGMTAINQGVRLNFGLARGIGSLTFAIISFFAGMMIKEFGTRIIPILIICIYVLFLIAVRNFSYQKVDSKKKGQVEAAAESFGESVILQQGEELHFFLQYKKYVVLLLGSTLVFVSHNMLNNFALQIMETKGGGSSEMGISMGLAALSELPIMFFFIWMVKKVRCDMWLKISGIFFMLKSLLTFFVDNVYGMYAIQGMQMMGFALYAVASVYYANSIMKKEDRMKGQAYMTVTNTMGGVLGAAIGGILIDNRGIPTLLIVSTVTAGIGMVIMWFAAEKTGLD